ncbi:hypothetical protein PFISCL1PPCAC_22191 [Pristionchus fissidentatus]|uniref:Protein kinase domain-containing protein n=1 Tax=Pristionchus fissidentatus TaxID=1538716 RepID=A0AAV5WMA2_9BILA|nr:hypothetical protein PFISCL1PPCAC_22191 [Pristionchus fissidentatus]
MVLELVFYSFRDIQKVIHKRSLASTAYFARESLKAIEALHSIGIVYGTMCPSDVFVGMPPHESKIYLANMSNARKFADELRCSTKPWMYASRAAHHGKEEGRKEDLESWFYNVVESTTRKPSNSQKGALESLSRSS